jgi:hypothetical protein
MIKRIVTRTDVIKFVRIWANPIRVRQQAKAADNDDASSHFCHHPSDICGDWSINRHTHPQKDEEKVRWHTQRGASPITYTDLSDLGNIMRNNWQYFEPHIPSAEWASAVFDIIER